MISSLFLVGFFVLVVCFCSGAAALAPPPPPAPSRVVVVVFLVLSLFTLQPHVLENCSTFVLVAENFQFLFLAFFFGFFSGILGEIDIGWWRRRGGGAEVVVVPGRRKS